MRPDPRLGLLGLTGILTACGSGGGDVVPGRGRDTFERPTTFTVEVDYETGAAPYEGMGSDSAFADNVRAIFPSLGDGYAGPATVGAMQDVGAVDDDSLTSDDILALAELHRDGGVTEGATRRLYVLYVDGYYEDDGEVRTNVLGVSIGRTGVIAMFKPVIESTSSVPSVRRQAEQAVMIHEFGHSAGLVDNGVDPVADHADAEHAAHCTNPDCVMFWEIHTGNNLLSFITAHMSGSDTVLFDADCLEDAEAHYGE